MHTIRIAGIDRGVSRICLGTGTFGSGIPRDEAFRILDAFAERGGTFLDTAHFYAAWLPRGTGASERTIGAWLASRGLERRMVIASKCGHPDQDSTRPARLKPVEIAHDLRESLERLALPAIDLYWLHRDDPEIPVEDILAQLEEHRASGRIRAYGASNWSTARLSAAQAAAHRKGWSGFVASQIGWSLAEAAPERLPAIGVRMMDAATLSWHRVSGMRVIPYSAQAGGYFAKPAAAVRGGLYDTPANRIRARYVADLAVRHRVTPNALALAWLLNHPCAGAAIIGPKTLEHLIESLSADRIVLNAETCSAMDHPQT